MGQIDKILKIKQTGLKLEAGNLLVSTPLLHDFFFGHSVILIVEHLKTSSMGFILNNMTQNLVGEIIPGLEEIDFPIYLGGPVSHDRAFFIHKNKKINDTIPLKNGLFWGGDIDQVLDFIKDGLILEKDIKFFIGHSGWGAKQLVNEIKANSWIITKPYSIDDIIQSSGSLLWKSTVAKLGEEYKKWFNFPINPMDN